MNAGLPEIWWTCQLRCIDGNEYERLIIMDKRAVSVSDAYDKCEEAVRKMGLELVASTIEPKDGKPLPGPQKVLTTPDVPPTSASRLPVVYTAPVYDPVIPAEDFFPQAYFTTMHNTTVMAKQKEKAA